MACCCMGFPTIDTNPWVIAAHYPNWPWRASLTTEHYGPDSKTDEMAPKDVKILLQNRQSTQWHISASGRVIPLGQDWIGQIFAADDVHVLMIPEAVPEGGIAETNTRIRHLLPCNEGIDPIKPVLPEFYKYGTELSMENRSRHTISWLPRRLSCNVEKFPRV